MPAPAFLPRPHVLVAALLLAGAAGARANPPDPGLVTRCEQELAPTAVDVVIAPSEVRYDGSWGLRELNAERSAGSGAVTLGHTVYRLSAQFGWGANTLAQPNGQGCLRPHLTVTLGFSEHLVRVAREFTPGSCGYRTVMAHENGHVDINHRALAAAAQELRAELSGFFGQRIFYGHVPTLGAQLTQAVRSDWMGLVEQRLEQGRYAHEAFDSPAEYARIGASCSGEITRIVRQTMSRQR